MLEKVEALADLDDKIDEQAKQLERAEDQRLRVRQTLLEHIAAVLVIHPVIDTKGTTCGGLGVGREQTPPQSPESLKSPPMTTGYDAESIRIYAGSEMHALLSVLNRETSAPSGTKNVA
jgi:Up-regulated During Septation